ncbi:MAG: FKBP-type peptidyl-prolyl cis-trans isomerase [Canibacter sp.]
MKRTLVLIPAIALAASMLVACSSSDDQSESSGPTDVGFECAASGAVSDSVKVSGDRGGDLKITADTPSSVKKQESTVAESGDGREIEEGDSVSVVISLFDGESGDAVTSEATAVGIQTDQVQAWVGNALACGDSKARVVSAAPVSSIWEDVAQTGLDKLKQDGDVIMVFDKLGALPSEEAPKDLLEKADGTAQQAPADYPAVTLADNGEPTITMPEGAEAPSELEISPLIEGDGEEVQPGDRVWVTYRGVIWRTGEEFDSSWKTGEPAGFITIEVINGFREALEGHTVGSQVVAIIPPEDGYGADGLVQRGFEPDDVMVFVFDIVGTVHAE